MKIPMETKHVFFRGEGGGGGRGIDTWDLSVFSAFILESAG